MVSLSEVFKILPAFGNVLSISASLISLLCNLAAVRSFFVYCKLANILVLKPEELIESK